jgi:hypothetical protein
MRLDVKEAALRACISQNSLSGPESRGSGGSGKQVQRAETVSAL